MQPAKLFLLASLFPLAACLPMQKKVPSGAEDFATYCAACHGDGAKGDGPMASTLDSTPADLTRLAARNKGVFPATAVMSKIWGYTEGPDGEMMPQFAPLLDGENMVLFDGGDGIATPTPLRLVQLAEYLKSIQR
ncbi:cytochrome c [Gemmobacter fulvus]|uniref:Cytochrome c n=1 Tax=Gemmobacter fulvus TaxID=2840474 RepID=A0A975P823_9RHOB|nr:cytochrome c [Gemmobacter fulvus]MBT9247390.1 cytochrome c [Gemmobacter fulvus]QWK90131.1 cytochrome c [Gemmobacter fulvus]